MEMLPLVAAAFVAVTLVTTGAALILLRYWPTLAADRLRPPSEEAGRSILRWEEQAKSGWQRAVERLGRAARPRDAGKLSRSRQQLVWAGYHNPRAVTLFFGSKVALALGAGYLYVLYGLLVQRALPNLLAVSLVLFVLGLFLPDLWLRRRVRARQRAIVKALPDIMDLLVVCVEAGLGFDAAIARVAEQPEGRRSPLHQELLRMHLEMRAGRPREEAMRALAERTPALELKSLIGAFVQAERLGTPLGKTLRVHSESARVDRRHRAEERAHLAPLKMIFPTVLFLMPAFFLVAMAPSLLGVLNLLQSLGR